MVVTYELNEICIYKSTDNLETWTLIMSFPTNNTKENFAINLERGAANDIVLFIEFLNDNFLYYSTDLGETFQELTGFEDLYAYNTINNQNLLGVKETVGDSAIYKLAVSETFDNWAIYDLPFEVADIEKFDNYLYAIDNYGYIYRTDLENYVKIEEIADETPMRTLKFSHQ